MPRYVVPDSCALAAGLYPETLSANADPLVEAIRSASVDTIAPELGIAEFRNVSRKKVEGYRHRGITYPPLPLAGVEAIVRDFLALPITWVDLRTGASGAWNLYATRNVQTYDAFFLEVAIQWEAELWTTDADFAAAAGTIYPRVFNLQTVAFT